MRLSAMVRSTPVIALAVVAFLLLAALIGGAATHGQTPAQRPAAGAGVQSAELVSSGEPRGHGVGCGSTCLPTCAGVVDDCVGLLPALSAAAGEHGPALPVAPNDSAPPRPRLSSQRARPAPSLVLLSIDRT